MPSSDKGWISLHRNILDSPLWSDRPFTKGQAWVDLILLANHCDHQGFAKGKIINFKRGTVYISQLEMAHRWGWDRKKVKRFLKYLESVGSVSVNATTNGTTVSIENYDFYQNNGANDGATDGQLMGQAKRINNNYKQLNNENKKEKVPRHKYGSYQNVLLSDEQLEKLKSEFPADWEKWIESLSGYMKSTGKTYKDHLATIRNWAKKSSNSDRKGVNKYGNSKKQNEGYEDLEIYLP